MKNYPKIFKLLHLGPLSLLLATMLHPGVAEGEDYPELEEKIQIQAEKLSYEQESGLYTISEEVVIKWKDVTLEADQVIYDSKQDILEAEGNVILKQGDDVLLSESLIYERQFDRGVVEKGELFIRKENYHFSGDEIERLGEEEYRITRSRFTTCDCGESSPSWEFAADKVKLNLGGYVQARNVVFYVKGVPVFYLPYGIFPIKTERQSGFLLPEVAYSRNNGFELSQPYFWAIARNMDSTFYLNYLSERGMGPAVEYRYILSRKSSGRFYTGYLHEFLLEDEHRWLGDYEHRQSFSPGFVGLVDLHRVSDLNYWRDFGERLEERSRPYLESRAAATKNWPEVSLVSELKYYQDLWAFDDFGEEELAGNGYFDEGEPLKDKETIQQFPVIDFVIQQQRIWKTPLYFDLESSFSNFWREAEGFDDFGEDGLVDTGDPGEGNDSFDPGETIREGQRVDLHPRISLPVTFRNYFQLSPSVGLQETSYFSELGEHKVKTREIYDVSMNFSSTFFRVFELKEGSKIKHSVRPEVDYVYLPPVDQDDLPLFDPVDRKEKESLLSYSLKNFIIGKSSNVSGNDTYRELVQLRIQQGYDFNRETHPFLPISGELEIKPQSWLYLKGDLDYHVYREKLLGLNSLCQLSDRRGDFIRVDYRFLADDPGPDDEPGTSDDITGNEWISGEAGVNLGNHFELSYRTRYSLLAEKILESGYGLKYISFCSKCWSLELKMTDRPGTADDRYSALITLQGLGSVGE